MNAKRRQVEIVRAAPRVEPNLTFTAFSPAQLREMKSADEDDRCVALIESCIALNTINTPEKPPWDPPPCEDRITDIDLARSLLAETHEPAREVDDWDAERVWREMYLREYDVSDRLREIAQKLDDALDEEINDIDDHNNEIGALSASARRLQLDLGW